MRVRDLRDPRSPLLLHSSFLVLNFRSLEEGQSNYPVKEGGRIPCPCELVVTTGVEVCGVPIQSPLASTTDPLMCDETG